MGFQDEIEAQHRVLVDCVQQVSELSAQSVLQTGERLGRLTNRALGLRRLVTEVTSVVAETTPSEVAGSLRAIASQLEQLSAAVPEDASSPQGELWASFLWATERMAQVVNDEAAQLESDAVECRDEVDKLVTNVSALTDLLLKQTAQAVSALQYQDPAIQNLRRLDSMVRDLRSSLDQGAESLAWGHRLGDAQMKEATSAEQLAARAKSVRDDTRARVARFQDDTANAVSQIQSVHASLHVALSSGNVAPAAAVEQLGSPRETLQRLTRECSALQQALDQYGNLFASARPAPPRRGPGSADDSQADAHPALWTAAADVRRVLERLQSASADGETLGSRVILASTQALVGLTSNALQPLSEHDERRQDVSNRLKDALRGVVDDFDGLRATDDSSTLQVRIQAPLLATRQAVERLFELIVGELGLDPQLVPTAEDWMADSCSEEDHASDEDGLILL